MSVARPSELVFNRWLPTVGRKNLGATVHILGYLYFTLDRRSGYTLDRRSGYSLDRRSGNSTTRVLNIGNWKKVRLEERTGTVSKLNLTFV